MKRGLLLLSLTLAGCSRCGDSPRPTAPLTVAAAADLSFAFGDLGAAFEKKTGQPVTFSFGSTGLLAKQIAEGAPFDLFAAANVSFVDDVVKSGACLGDTKTSYASGRIVMWTRKGAKNRPTSVADLARPEFVKIAIANPDHAPYGKAARQAITTAGVWRSVQPRVVYGENVQQTLQFAQSGNADVAIVALSLATVTTDGEIVAIDPATHDRLDQALVVCKGSPQSGGTMIPVAKQLAAFIVSDEGRAVMNRYGLSKPETSPPVTARPFGAFCEKDTECAAGICFHKRAANVEAVEASGYCSLRCEGDLDCPAPPTTGHCGARGICK